MSTVRPFRAVRPVPEYAAQVAALPYDVMDSAEAREAVKGRPYSFIHVDKAEVDLPEGTDVYSSAVYDKARENLDRLEADGITAADPQPMLYIYRQTWQGREQTGIVGCASVDEYLNGTIKKHENTRADKEADRIRHVDRCSANTGPIFLTYRDSAAVDAVVAKYTGTLPVYDFTANDVRNTVWVISAADDITALTKAFTAVPSLYIADGHHRAASAVKVALRRRESNPGWDGSEEFNFFLAVFFPVSQLRILDYNRLIKDKNGMKNDELLAAVGKKFIITPASDQVKPASRHHFGLYTGKKWYELEAKDGTFDPNDPVSRLDVSILQNNCIAPVFGIDDPRRDPRIDFVGGIRGLDELERRTSGPGADMAVAFSMFPTTLDDLMAIADAGLIMPPKSTWFEPKLLSGLFIHKI